MRWTTFYVGFKLGGLKNIIDCVTSHSDIKIPSLTVQSSSRVPSCRTKSSILHSSHVWVGMLRAFPNVCVSAARLIFQNPNILASYSFLDALSSLSGSDQVTICVLLMRRLNPLSDNRIGMSDINKMEKLRYNNPLVITQLSNLPVTQDNRVSFNELL